MPYGGDIAVRVYPALASVNELNLVVSMPTFTTLNGNAAPGRTFPAIVRGSRYRALSTNGKVYKARVIRHNGLGFGKWKEN